MDDCRNNRDADGKAYAPVGESPTDDRLVEEGRRLRNAAHMLIDRLIMNRQEQARRDMQDLFIRLRVFADVLATAYGRDISRTEMLDALRSEFLEGLEGLRRFE